MCQKKLDKLRGQMYVLCFPIKNGDFPSFLEGTFAFDKKNLVFILANFGGGEFHSFKKSYAF